MSDPPREYSIPPETRVGRTALAVGDIDRLTEFYSDVVGLEVTNRSNRAVSLGVGGEPLLVLEGAPETPDRSPAATGLYHNAFRVPSRGALGDALTRVREHRQLDGATDHLVSEALYLTDPEGNGVEIYRDRPREEWPVGEDGRVNMANEPLDLDALAAAADGDAGVPAATDVGHVHLEVSTVAAFEEFYVDALGFEVRDRFRGATFVGAGGYHHHVGGNVWNGRSEPGTGLGLAWFEIVVPDADTLDSLRTRLSGGAVTVAETDDGPVVEDRDENEIRIRAER